MKKFYVTCISIITITSSSVFACETCALYSPPDRHFLFKKNSEHLYKLNWFTRYSNLDTRLTGTKESNSRGEDIESYINQLALEYNVSPNFKAQVSLPILNRDFKVRDGDHLRSDDESGVGDISLIGKYVVHETETDKGKFSVTLIGGLKTPTGDSDRIGGDHGHADEPTAHNPAAEQHEAVDHHAAEMTHHGFAAGAVTEHHGAEQHAASAISGHDVSLGSGSWDIISGIKTLYSTGDWMVDSMVQYYWRTEGDFDYEFADDLYVSAHLGRILARSEDLAFGVRAGILGEFRDADEQNGIAIKHTQLDSWYADLTATLAHGRFLGEAGIDIPIEQDSGAATLVPDLRFRFSAGVFF